MKCGSRGQSKSNGQFARHGIVISNWCDRGRAQEIADFFARKHPNAIFIAQWRADLTIKDKPCPNGIRIVDAAEIAGNIPFIAHLMSLPNRHFLDDEPTVSCTASLDELHA